MKKLFIILLMTVSLQSFSQDSIPLKISETERIIDKYSSQVINGFEKIIEKTTPYAEEGFKMVVRLEIAKGIVGLFPLIAFFLFFFSFKKEYNKIFEILRSENVPSHMEKRYGPFYEENANPYLIFCFIASILFLLLVICSTYFSIMRLISPEWFAIKEIIELI